MNKRNMKNQLIHESTLHMHTKPFSFDGIALCIYIYYIHYVTTKKQRKQMPFIHSFACLFLCCLDSCERCINYTC